MENATFLKNCHREILHMTKPNHSNTPYTNTQQSCRALRAQWQELASKVKQELTDGPARDDRLQNQEVRIFFFFYNYGENMPIILFLNYEPIVKPFKFAELHIYIQLHIISALSYFFETPGKMSLF